jgi:hypothetical protein
MDGTKQEFISVAISKQMRTAKALKKESPIKKNDHYPPRYEDTQMNLKSFRKRTKSVCLSSLVKGEAKCS